MDEAWEEGWICFRPTKITLYIGKTGVDGDTFKNKYLMDKFRIKTGLCWHGTIVRHGTPGGITYLTNVLLKIADELDDELKSLNDKEKKRNSR
jgi:arginine decarboxylase